MIQIDRGIPIPPAPPQGRPQGAPGIHLYPWREMEVGDSFVFTAGDLMEARKRISARKGWDRQDYAARRLDGVIRIWRVA